MQHSVRSRASVLVAGVDPWLSLTLLAIMCVGVLMVYSASIADAYAYYGSQYYVVERELFFVVVGSVALIVTSKTRYHLWQRFAAPLFAGSLALLALVLTPHIGHMSHGARRWFSLGANMSLEPSELVKLTMIMYLATWLPSKGDRVRDFRSTFVPFSMVVGTIFLLIVKQPDLGTAIVVAATAMAVFFVAGAEVSHMAMVMVGSSGFAWVLMHSSSYRQDRLTAFLNPWHDPSGVGYHTIQALLALGSGGMFGDGLGNSAQKWVLPAPHTDSILAVIGEEFGLAGTVGVLLLFVIMAYRGMRIAMGAPDAFGRLLAAGISSWIAFQALMNFAVITSSVPFTGVPLPFVSYGGTSLVITMAAIGILLNISRHATGEDFASHNSYHGRRDRRARLPRAVGDTPFERDGPVPGSGLPHVEAGAQPVRRIRRTTAR
ncbi:MAG: stage V sporulation protein E [Chloroflexota bacterium]